jgi:pimeloyl-ACP methyl ester carboxylesterase
VPPGLRVRTVRSGDVSLALREAGDPVRPTVVMIHGYPDTKEVWEPVMDRLAPDFHVVAYDVRGAGASGAPRPAAAYDLERLAGDFAAVRQAVAPDRPVHLVGHDWGGIQGWEFVSDPRFDGAIASFTSIAGPALAHAVRATRRPLRAGQVAEWFRRARRSWYIVPLCLPGGPQLAWRVVIGPRRWRRYLQLEGVPADAGYPSPTLCADGLNGAKLYRQNIPRRILGRRPAARAHAPVQLIVPSGDRFISASYYDAAEQAAPGLRRRVVPGSHWAIRTEPGLVSEWVAEFARGSSTPDPPR